MPGLEAGLADRRGLLIARRAEDRNGGAEDGFVGHAEIVGIVLDHGKQGAGHAEEVEQLVVPVAAFQCCRAASGRRWSRRSRAKHRWSSRQIR